MSVERWDGFNNDELAHLVVALIERDVHIEKGDVEASDVPRLLANEARAVLVARNRARC